MSRKSVCAHWRGMFIPPSYSLAAVLQRQSLLKRENWKDRERETLCHCGSEITNSIVLCWVTCLLSNFLPVTAEERKVWRERESERPTVLLVPLIFFSLCSAKYSLHLSSKPLSGTYFQLAFTVKVIRTSMNNKYYY